MARILRTAAANRDLVLIAEYIAADKPLAAEKWIDDVDRTLVVIARQPYMGEKVDHLARGMRRHCMGNYLLFYVPIEGGIELRRVLHAARRIDELF